MFMEWLRKAPTTIVITVFITCGLLASVLVAAYVVLEINGADTAEFRRWVGTLGQLLVYPMLGITTIASVSSARSSSRAEDQTNGQLQSRDAELDLLRIDNAALRRELEGK